jgi:hypothetical protein
MLSHMFVMPEESMTYNVLLFTFFILEISCIIIIVT